MERTTQKMMRICLVLGLVCLVCWTTIRPGRAAGPPNIVTNADFSSGLSDWNDTGSMPWDNFNGYAEVTSFFHSISVLQQCIVITQQPAGNNWNFSADMTDAGRRGYLTAEARFYTSADCSATAGDTLLLTVAASSTSGAWVTTYNSVMVELICEELDGTSGGPCTVDNVFLGNDPATAVGWTTATARGERSAAGAWLGLAALVVGLAVVMKQHKAQQGQR